MGGYARSGVMLSAGLLALAVAGCSSVGSIGTVHQPESFGAKKTYAVVTVMAEEKVGCSEAGGNMCNGGVFGLVNMATKTNAYHEPAAEVLESTYPAVLQALRSSPNLKIIPDVKGNRVYRAATEDAQPTGTLRLHHTVAKGYKYFSDENLARLASDLKVDGVITVTLAYTAARGGVTVGGVGGKHQARSTLTVRALNREGKTVWFDHAAAVSDGGVGTGTGAVDFPKLRPFFVESTDKAAKKLMENFNGKEGKT
jgi:hypothetical protein